MHYREQVLHNIALQIERSFPNVLVGWDLGLAAGPPEEGITILEAFSVDESDELEFIRATRPLVKWAIALLGTPVMLVPHDPRVTGELYGAVPAKIHVLREKLQACEKQESRQGRLATHFASVALQRAG